MTSPSVDNNNDNKNGPIGRAFQGPARDASLLLATVAVAATPAPVHMRGKGKGGAVWVPGEVVEVGRKAQASSVDSTAASKGWISVDAESGAVSATAVGRTLVESMDAEITATVRWRLESWALGRVREIVGGVSSPGPFSSLNAVGQWVLTHGLWIVCSSREEDCDGSSGSHDGSANWMMSVRWWGSVGERCGKGAV